ncbi:MAG: hypothetical protein K8J08_05600 [Thermoanaerobaculia bacterium]|nr:hypothetical protein [Thermoanaerobaculia bacterium]
MKNLRIVSFAPSFRPGAPPTLTGIQRPVVGLLLGGLLFGAIASSAQLFPPPDPPGNATTPAKARLGKVLFWDEQISSTRTVSCGTCHLPENGGDDARSGVDPLAVHPGHDGTFNTPDDVFGSPGVPLNLANGLYDWSPDFGLTAQVTPRRTVSTINAGYAPELFWDGRAPSEFVDPVTLQVVIPFGGALESQAVGPPTNDVEMGHVGRDWIGAVARIESSAPLAVAANAPPRLLNFVAGRSYPELFTEAFGDPEISAARVAMAIASHERTLFSNQTPFDDFLVTNMGLTAQELSGRAIFSATCDNCHVGVQITDHQFHYTGVHPNADDIGRGEVTGLADDMGKMKTPGLRNVALRAPYMHNGRFETLEEVIDFYDRGGDFPGGTVIPGSGGELYPPNELVALGLTPQDKADLLAFLTRPLTDPRLVEGLPPFDRPILFTESNRVPVLEGTGLPGSGGLIPWVVAIEPPVLGNPSFTVAIWNALGGANALLVIDDEDPGLTLPGSGSFAFESIVLDGVGTGLGFGSVSLSIPDDTALNGAEWFGRWYVEDTGGGEAAAVSQLFRFRTFMGLSEAVLFVDGFESGNTSAW